MFGRKRRRSAARSDADAHVIATPESDHKRKVVQSDRSSGPWDIDERPEKDDGEVDLGAIRIRLAPGMQISARGDARTGKVNKAMVVAGDSAIQLLAVAAPRSRRYWDEIRGKIVQSATKQGGSATEYESAFGTALRLNLPVLGKDGKQVTDAQGRRLGQPSRVIGIDGPRWMLKVTLLGKAAVDDEAEARLMPTVRHMVINRGDAAMLPGEPLSLTPVSGPEQSPDEAAGEAAEANEQARQ